MSGRHSETGAGRFARLGRTCRDAGAQDAVVPMRPLRYAAPPMPTHNITPRVVAPLFALALAVVAPAFAQVPSAPFHPQDFDTTCSPCRDFDQFANGGWRARTKLPPGYSSYTAFEEVYDNNEVILRRVLERAAADKKAAPSSDWGRLGTYYSTCMDSMSAEKAGKKPIEGLLAEIDAMKSPRDLAPRLAWLHAHGVPAMFGFFARQDPGNSEQVIAFASQGGLSLPDRDYYLRTDSAAVATRATWVTQTTTLFTLVGENPNAAKAHAEAVLALETSFANASMTNVQRRDPKATYH